MTVGYNPDTFKTHWERLAGSWQSYWEGCVRNEPKHTGLAQREKCMLDICNALLELDHRIRRLEKAEDANKGQHETVNQLKEQVRKLRGMFVARMAGTESKGDDTTNGTRDQKI